MTEASPRVDRTLYPRVAFRADASNRIGTGHVMRCLALAESITRRGGEARFVSRAHEGNLIDLIKRRGHPVAVLPSTREAHGDGSGGTPHEDWLETSWGRDASETSAALDAAPAVDWLIVDHYALDARWERRLHRAAPRLAVIDDLADRDHDADLLVDVNPAPGMATRYDGLVPDQCVQLLGPRYALLRSEFVAARGSLDRSPGPAAHWLVMFGGFDERNDTLTALEVLEDARVDGVTVDVVVGPMSRHSSEVAAWCAGRQWVRLHRAPQNVATLMAGADVAIGAGGITTFERLFLALPSLVTPVAENQEVPLRTMASSGWFHLWFTADELRRQVETAIAAGLPSPPDVVGDGASTVASILADMAVQISPPDHADLERVFAWLQDPRLRAEFMVRDRPTLEGHLAYWEAALADARQVTWGIRLGSRHVGMAGLREIGPPGGSAEAWIYLGDAADRGRGIGRAAMRAVLREARVRYALARVQLHVRRDNEAAQALYRAVGFAASQLPLERRWAGREPEVMLMEVQP